MEMQFEKTEYSCLYPWADQVTTQEQTQELRLPDAMPDVGTVLGAWGQLLLRGKEWRGDGMSISGGVMTWVLYAPEDGSMPRVAEGWIPFQMRWDFPQAERDGNIQVSCLLRSVDGRCLSARKLLLRCVVSVAAQAWEPGSFAVYRPGKTEEDVQLLTRSYPLCCPAEAGEKMFALDEELELPADIAGGGKLLHCQLLPQITDRKLMGDKAVFRGVGVIQCLVRTESGEVKSCTLEQNFSQYAQLDREYGEHADLRVIPAVTSLEPELTEQGRLRLKAGLTGQYMVYDRPMVELVEDAYSPRRSIKLQMGQLTAPRVLDMHREVISARQTVQDLEPVDISFGLQQPGLLRDHEGVQLSLDGTFSALGTDGQGQLRGMDLKWEESRGIQAHRDTRLTALCSQAGLPTAVRMGDGVELGCDVALETLTMASEPLPQVIGLELGELRQPDPGRPALVLRRAGKESLWQLAKEENSTVQAIQNANGLTSEPEMGRMLLIPVS